MANRPHRQSSLRPTPTDPPPSVTPDVPAGTPACPTPAATTAGTGDAPGPRVADTGATAWRGPDPAPGGLLRLAWAGLKAVLLLPVRPGSVPSGAGVCAVAVVLITLIGIAGERWLLASDDVAFNWTGLRAAWFDLPILLLGSAWLAQPRRNAGPSRIPLLHFAAVVLGAAFWIVTIAYTLFVADTLGAVPERIGSALADWVYLVAPVWSFIVAIRALGTMQRFQPIGARRRLVVLMALALASAWSILDPIEPYWLAPEAPAPEIYVGGPGAPEPA